MVYIIQANSYIKKPYIFTIGYSMIAENWQIFEDEDGEYNDFDLEGGVSSGGKRKWKNDGLNRLGRDAMKGRKPRGGREDVRTKEKKGSFKCSHCDHMIPINEQMGTQNRNHCPDCLWSKHLDIKPGDRKSDCHGGMEPIALTFKNSNSGTVGEIMIVHSCCSCGTIDVNRIAADDNVYAIRAVFASSLDMSEADEQRLAQAGIEPATADMDYEVHSQLFGKIIDSTDQ